MKKILVLTDLSDNSVHAARYAAVLASRMHKKLFLFHTYVALPVIPSYAGAPWVPQDLVYDHRRRQARLECLAEDLDTSPGPNASISIEILNDQGPLPGHVKKLVSHNDIEMVVMGAGSGGRMEHLLNGRDTLAVIEVCRRPVLVVPSAAEGQAIRKILFATAFYDRDISAVRYLIKLARSLNAELEVVHLLPLHGGVSEDEQETRFLHLLNKFNYPLITYRKIHGKDISSRLLKERKEYDADLLALSHHKHGFFTELFTPDTVRKILSRHKFPVLVLPEDMQGEE